MTPEEIAKLIADSVAAATAASNKAMADQFAAVNASLTALKAAPDKAAADRAAADKAAADKAAADKVAADAAAGHKGTPEENATIAELKRAQAASDARIKKLTDESDAANKRAADAEQRTAIDGALKDFSFAGPEARQTAFDLLNSRIKRTDDGALIAGDNLPVDAFAKDFLPTHSYLLAPENRGGSGARGGTGPGGKVPTIESIEVGASKETLDAARVQILSVLKNDPSRK